ncbi:hypothetical protein Q0F98_29470 [Paenibacillus amylolyticus]|nr:hypothetical protein Q0F98_29470 [Paenibacillus amylolyticus]
MRSTPEFVRELCFDEIFKYADQISDADKQNFIRIMDLFADVLVWYGEKEQEARKLIRIDSDLSKD